MTPAVHDLTLLGLFSRADLVVKAVMVLLLATSVCCWAVVLDKAVRLARHKRHLSGLDQALRAGTSAETLTAKPGDPAAAVLAAGLEEWRLGASVPGDIPESRAEQRERIERAMRAMMSREMQRLETFLPLLATTGSAAPFIGLFGTVWGIMNSFTAIAQSNNTNLSVVAPGIAEALLATAMGLVAAIPAVIAFNKLSSEMRRYAGSMNSMIGDLGARLSRRSGPLATEV